MRVLLATDGSNDANTATEWLKGLPLPANTTVLILTVAALPSPPTDDVMMKDLRDTILQDAHRVSGETRRLLESRWPEAEARVTEGDPREEIIKAAEEWGADLVVVGARGLGAIKGFLLGSVSHAVARHAPCPVLVVKGRPQPLRSAVLAVDGSDDSLHAVRFFAALEPGGEVKVHLEHVIEPVRFPSSAPGFIRARLKAALAELRQERTARAKAMLELCAAELGGTARPVELLLAEGLAGEKIVQAADENGVDLVVVGAHGLGRMKRLLLGSVSEKVLSSARCPVLITKRPAGRRSDPARG